MKTATERGLARAIEDLGESIRVVCCELANSLRQVEPPPPPPLPSPPPSRTATAKEPPTAGDDSRRRQLLTVKQFADTQPAFTESSVRWLIFNGEWNRFNEVIVRVGRRVLIDTERFDEWLRLPAEEREARPRPA